MRFSTAVLTVAAALLLGDYFLTQGQIKLGFATMAAGWLIAGYFYNDRRR